MLNSLLLFRQSQQVLPLRGESGEPYVAKTSNLRRRLQRLLEDSEGLAPTEPARSRQDA